MRLASSRARVALVLYFFVIRVRFYNMDWQTQTTEQNQQQEESQQAQKRRRISFQLLRNTTLFRNLYNPYMQCDPASRRALSPGMQRTLGFTTTVSTDLKVLFMGDSVSIQNSQTFEEAVGGNESNHTVLRFAWGTVEGLHLNTNIRGGGVVAGWRITALLQAARRQEKPFANVPGGHWIGSDVDKLLSQPYHNSKNATTIGSFDALILRIPHGWMSLDQITREGLQEAIELAHSLFGVQNVIILTLPFINNIQNPGDLAALRATNAMIQDFARAYSSKNNTGVDQVLTLEFGRLGDAVIALNAEQMGYNTTNNDYLFDQCCPVEGLKRSIANVCAERASSGSRSCPGNMITRDGMHFCTESFNGRITAGVSCLLSCIYDGSDSDTPACAQNCNDSFMSLLPIEHFDDEDADAREKRDD